MKELSFLTIDPLPNLWVYRYQVRLQTVDDRGQAASLGQVAHRLKTYYQQPILADTYGNALVSSIALSMEPNTLDRWGFEVLAQETIDLGEPRYDRFLDQVCSLRLCQTFQAKGCKVDSYRKRIYSRQEQAVRQSDWGESEIRAWRYLKFSFAQTDDRRLLVSLDFAHEYESSLTIDQLDMLSFAPGQRLVDRYNRKLCYWQGVGSVAVGQPLPELGNQTLLDYHRTKGHLTEAAAAAIDPQSLAVNVTYPTAAGPGPVCPHLPQLLQKVFDRGDLDPATTSQCLLSIDEKFTLGIQTIQLLGRQPFEVLPDTDLNPGGVAVVFNCEPRSPEGRRHLLATKAAEKNLDFGCDPQSPHEPRYFAYPTAGLAKHYLWQRPTEIRSAVLLPENWDREMSPYLDALKAELAAYGIDLKRASTRYQPQDPLSIREACQKIKAEADLVLGVVPHSGDPEYDRSVDPYKTIKRFCLGRGLPSQMVTRDRPGQVKRWQDAKGRNLILGLLAKLGYGAWRLREMPGEADLFVGLDLGRKEGRSIGAAAVVFDRTGEAIGWSCFEFASGKETFDAQSLRNLLFDLVTDYRQERGRSPRRIVIHRDGRLPNAELATLQALGPVLAEAGVQGLDAIEIVKDRVCRAGISQVDPDTGQTTYRNPPKGWVWPYCAQEAIVLTTGDREAKINPKASPQPLTIRRRLGDTDLLTLAAQVYWLSEMHIGSTQTVRLPITTYYADRAAACVLAGYGPLTGRRDRRLWFL